MSRTLSYRRRLGLFLVATLLGFAVVLLRSRSYRADRGDFPTEAVFYLTKASWREVATVVFAGDSRTAMGVSPTQVGPIFEGAVARNVAFGMTNFSDEYLDYVEGTLVPSAPRRVIALGLTPLAMLTDARAPPSHFATWSRTPRRDRTLEILAGPLSMAAEPLGIRNLSSALRGRPLRFAYRFHADGWMELLGRGKRPDYYRKRQFYLEYFANNPVSAAARTRTLEATRAWTAKGITVFGFRPPTPLWMRALEAEKTEYADGEIRRIFEAAGGRWVEVDYDRYRSIDGSHLADDQALRFSADLGEALRKALAAHP